MNTMKTTGFRLHEKPGLYSFLTRKEECNLSARHWMAVRKVGFGFSFRDLIPLFKLSLSLNPEIWGNTILNRINFFHFQAQSLYKEKEQTYTLNKNVATNP